MGVVVTSTFDAEGVVGRMQETSRRVLTRHRKYALDFVKAQWVGWVYKGRAPSAPRLVSQRRWRAEVQTTVAPFSLDLLNDKDYVEHVHRTGTTAIEYVAVANELRVSAMVMQLRQDLAASLAEDMKKPGKPKKIAGRTTERATGSKAI